MGGLAGGDGAEAEKTGEGASGRVLNEDGGMHVG